MVLVTQSSSLQSREEHIQGLPLNITGLTSAQISRSVFLVRGWKRSCKRSIWGRNILVLLQDTVRHNSRPRRKIIPEMYVPDAIPTYPVSSLNSLTALSSACSPSSTRPAGTSITTLLIGGRNCFCKRSSGPEGF